MLNPKVSDVYRQAADMPEIKIKKEWYCTLDNENICLSTGPVWVTLTIALFAAGALLVFEPNKLINWAWVRYLALIVGYMLVWSAIFMRRREVKE